MNTAAIPETIAGGAIIAPIINPVNKQQNLVLISLTVFFVLVCNSYNVLSTIL